MGTAVLEGSKPIVALLVCRNVPIDTVASLCSPSFTEYSSAVGVLGIDTRFCSAAAHDVSWAPMQAETPRSFAMS